MTATHFEPTNDFLPLDETPSLRSQARATYLIEDTSTRTLPFETLILSVIAMVVVGGLAVLLGWQIAAILAAAMVLKAIGAWIERNAYR